MRNVVTARVFEYSDRLGGPNETLFSALHSDAQPNWKLISKHPPFQLVTLPIELAGLSIRVGSRGGLRNWRRRTEVVCQRA